MELYLPTELVGPVQRAAEGQSVTAWICATLARAAGVEYTPRKRGRPPKTDPTPKPPTKRKRPAGGK